MNRAPHISDDLISRLSEFVNSRTGLHFPRQKWRDLRRNISAAAPDLGFDDTTACIEWLLSASLTQEQKDTLVGHLTIGETFFFRDKFIFQVLKERILPVWIETHGVRKNEITFWSAACCAGEEPYSIAMLIHQMPMFRGWKVRIIGTDINARFLQKARKGIYTPWSFRDTPDEILRGYFKKRGKNSFEISPAIRKMVSFSQHNLVGKGYPPELNGYLNEQGKADIILCRNVLMYLSADMRDKVIQRLTGLLSKEGWFIVSPSETSFVQVPNLNPVRFPGAVFHRKGSPRKADKKAAKVVFPWKTREQKKPRKPAVTPLSARPVTPAYNGKTSGPRAVPPPAKREKRKEPRRDLFQESLGLYEKGRYEEVAEKLNRLLSDGKKGDNVLLVPEQMALLAKAYANMGKLDEARKWCEQTVQTEKLNPDYHYLLASIYQEQGLVEEPIKSLRHAIYLDPDLVMAYFLLGHLIRGHGKPGESISETPLVCYRLWDRGRLYRILTDSQPRGSRKPLD
ncbi:MAG: tetratricopeptide repeat protein [Deltaproteobacteria bacterium]|nr:tetratricopeptide repeat protein [Deltaproteobacteria bacterium]